MLLFHVYIHGSFVPCVFPFFVPPVLQSLTALVALSRSKSQMASMYVHTSPISTPIAMFLVDRPMAATSSITQHPRSPRCPLATEASSMPENTSMDPRMDVENA